MPLQLRPELDRVEPLSAAVKKPNPFAVGVQLEAKFAAQHEVRPSRDLRSRRENKLARLGRIVGEAHADQVGGFCAIVEQLDLVRRIAAWPSEHLVDEQARIVWSNRPHLRSSRLAKRLPRARAVFADDTHNIFSGREPGQPDRLVDGMLAAQRPVVDAVAVVRDARPGDDDPGACFACRRGRLSGDRRSAWHTRAHVEPVRPSANRG